MKNLFEKLLFTIKTNPIFSVLILLLIIESVVKTDGNFMDWLYEKVMILPGIIIGISFHEFAHAYVADKLGDDTPRMQGRLNLNPLTHIDPIGFILLMFAGFGWGKPVQINTANFNRNIDRDKGEAIVSLAGPIMNFILAILSAIILGAIYMFAPASFFYGNIGNIVYILLQELVIINIGLGIFNTITTIRWIKSIYKFLSI